jgi:phospholipid/cholesterol/gamma-HCH transport system permease protein
LSPPFEAKFEHGTLHLSGMVDRHHMRPVSLLIRKHLPKQGQTLKLHLGGVERLDSAAVATLIHGWRLATAQGGTIELVATSPNAQHALAMFRVGDAPRPAPKAPGLVEGVGRGSYAIADAASDFMRLAVEASLAVLASLWSWRTTKWHHVVDQCIYIGSQALPIVGLVSLLVGLTLAFQSAYQLQQFGAAIYVADLTGVAIVREMGPLITAILVAGRSGSSIAAEIGTMKVAEEIDALTVMGMQPMRYLGVPRLLAIVLMVPLLTVLADLLGILGGFIVGIFYLDIAWNAFALQMLKSLAPFDLVSGLMKAGAFAYGIGLIGLHYGFQVSGGAGEVGRTTTASVVASLFYIIVADSLFSVLFYIIL